MVAPSRGKFFGSDAKIVTSDVHLISQIPGCISCGFNHVVHPPKNSPLNF